MRGQRVSRDRSPGDRPAEDERGPDHRDPVLLFDDDRRGRTGLAQALERTRREQGGPLPAGEEIEQRGAIDGGRHDVSIRAVDLDGQTVGCGVLFEGRPAAIELKDRRRVHLGHGQRPPPWAVWRSGERDTRL